MAEIGSGAWIDSLRAALAGLDVGDAEVSVLHRIEGGPAWRIVVSGGNVAVHAAGPDDDADLTFTWQRADAEAVALGEISPLEPFQAGRLRIGGDLSRLSEVAGLFARFPHVPVG